MLTLKPACFETRSTIGGGRSVCTFASHDRNFCAESSDTNTEAMKPSRSHFLFLSPNLVSLSQNIDETPNSKLSALLSCSHLISFVEDFHPLAHAHWAAFLVRHRVCWS